MVLIEQISALLDFLERYPEVAVNTRTTSRSLEGRTLAQKRWGECAAIMNSVAAGCPQKSARDWRLFYNEYKSKLMRKLKQHRIEQNATGFLAKKPMLTALQKRLYNIIEDDLEDYLTIGKKQNTHSSIAEKPVVQNKNVLDKDEGMMTSVTGFQVYISEDTGENDVDIKTEAIWNTSDSTIPTEIIETTVDPVTTHTSTEVPDSISLPIEDEANGTSSPASSGSTACDVYRNNQPRTSKVTRTRPKARKGKQQESNDGKRELNLAITEYYRAKRKKLDLQSELLQLQIVNEKRKLGLQ